MLNQEKVKIDDIVSHQYRFEAHENETVQEHTDKCVMFFEQIWKAKKLDSTLEMLEQLVDDDSELISLYYGQDVTEEEADAFTQEVEKLYPDIDVDVHCGGQPIYYYVLAVE